MNRQWPKGIEWTNVFGPGSGFTWNPVVGCTKRCGATPENPKGYCYARGLAGRIGHLCKQYPTAEQVEQHGLDPDLSLCAQYWPHFHEERLEQPLKRRKPAGIFLGSMCDLWDPHVEQGWRDAIWDVIEQTPQHLYWVLTQLGHLIGWTERSRWASWEWGQLWVGVTLVRNDDLWRQHQRADRYLGNTFISFEPLHGPMPDWKPVANDIGWVIVGAETGNRPGKVTPKREWVEGIVERAAGAGIPVFVKDNLIPVMGEQYVREHQEWPEAMTGHGT